MDKLFNAYRFLAYIVGTMLLAGCAMSVLAHFWTEGSGPQQFGERFLAVWMAHGFAYMAYVVVGFALWRRERWTVVFALTMFVAGLIPVLIFWVEKQVEHKVLNPTTA